MMQTFSENERRLVSQQLNVLARDDGSSHKGLIDDALLEGVCALVDKSGVLEAFAEWHEEAHRGPGGRPAVYGPRRDRLVLVLMLVLVMTNRRPQLAAMSEVVLNRLSASGRGLLGISVDNGRTSKIAIYHRIHRAWRRFVAVCDPLPGPTHRRMPRATVEELIASIDPTDSAIKWKRMRWVMNTLLEMTWQLLDENTRAQWLGNLAMDSTVLPTWGRGGHNHENQQPTDLLSPEFHAYWNWMHDDRMVFGFALHLAVTVPDPYRECRHPMLAIAASMGPPSKDIGGHFTSMLQSIAKRSHPTKYAIADRGILGHVTAPQLNRPLYEAGYQPVMDYRSDQVGHVQGAQRGAVYIAGAPYCPATPQPLIEAETKYVKTKDWRTYREALSRRDLYRFKRKDGDAWFCPASGPNATASCPLKPGGPIPIGMPTLKVHTVVYDPPADNAPDCCIQGQVSLPASGTTAEKYLQPVPYRSQEWEDLYDMRTLVETFNGYTKDGNNEALAEPTNRRVRGFAANAMIALACLIASNMRKIRAFYAAGEPPLMDPRPRPTKRGYTRPPSWVIYGKKSQYGRPRRRRGPDQPATPAVA